MTWPDALGRSRLEIDHDAVSVFVRIVTWTWWGRRRVHVVALTPTDALDASAVLSRRAELTQAASA